MFTGRTLTSFTEELKRQDDTRQDYVVPAAQMELADNHLRFHGQREYAYPVTQTALRQLGNFLEIPWPYMARMQENTPALLEKNVNTWLERNSKNRLVRTTDGKCRAFLSPKYRPIDNWEVARRALSTLDQLVGLDDKNVSCEITDENMYIKVTDHKRQGEVKVGDVISSGVSVTNSELGYSNVIVSPFVNRLICTNGSSITVPGQPAIKTRHIGHSIRFNPYTFEISPESENSLAIRNHAYLDEMAAVIRELLNGDTFDEILSLYRLARERYFTGTNNADLVEAIAKEYGLTAEDSQGILAHFERDPDAPSVYALSNAVTRYSQDVGDYTTATRLEAAGGHIINMSENQFHYLKTYRMKPKKAKQDDIPEYVFSN